MSLISKLKVKPESLFYLVNADAEILPHFDNMVLKTSFRGHGPVNQVLLFVNNSRELNAAIEKLVDKLGEDALLWIAYPKKSSGITSDLNRDEGWALLKETGYDGVASVSINEKWSAVRFRKLNPSSTYTRSVPMEERRTEGVDYIKRTVELPVDAIKALTPYKGLADFFNSMSFTHKKEYVEAINEAKKPETRQRRIEKMVEALLIMKAEKEKKKK